MSQVNNEMMLLGSAVSEEALPQRNGRKHQFSLDTRPMRPVENYRGARGLPST